ncbi:hypothetical protein AMS68_005494 [Peltaster fructicola]|uniref:Uncharacterized protein n=1 Tax=Peltaster fructicola TaxID=286661 RepID=A0A6H0XYZ9_9PEZI|nr:hypothetical protein AMS68_005494 [Peltaster fructicola]
MEVRHDTPFERRLFLQRRGEEHNSPPAAKRLRIDERPRDNHKPTASKYETHPNLPVTIDLTLIDNDQPPRPLQTAYTTRNRHEPTLGHVRERELHDYKRQASNDEVKSSRSTSLVVASPVKIRTKRSFAQVNDEKISTPDRAPIKAKTSGPFIEEGSDEDTPPPSTSASVSSIKESSAEPVSKQVARSAASTPAAKRIVESLRPALKTSVALPDKALTSATLPQLGYKEQVHWRSPLASVQAIPADPSTSGSDITISEVATTLRTKNGEGFRSSLLTDTSKPPKPEQRPGSQSKTDARHAKALPVASSALTLEQRHRLPVVDDQSRIRGSDLHITSLGRRDAAGTSLFVSPEPERHSYWPSMIPAQCSDLRPTKQQTPSTTVSSDVHNVRVGKTHAKEPSLQASLRPACSTALDRDACLKNPTSSNISGEGMQAISKSSRSQAWKTPPEDSRALSVRTSSPSKEQGSSVRSPRTAKIAATQQDHKLVQTSPTYAAEQSTPTSAMIAATPATSSSRGGQICTVSKATSSMPADDTRAKSVFQNIMSKLQTRRGSTVQGTPPISKTQSSLARPRSTTTAGTTGQAPKSSDPEQMMLKVPDVGFANPQPKLTSLLPPSTAPPIKPVELESLKLCTSDDAVKTTDELRQKHIESVLPNAASVWNEPNEPLKDSISDDAIRSADGLRQKRIEQKQERNRRNREDDARADKIQQSEADAMKPLPVKSAQFANAALTSVQTSPPEASRAAIQSIPPPPPPPPPTAPSEPRGPFSLNSAAGVDAIREIDPVSSRAHKRRLGRITAVDIRLLSITNNGGSWAQVVEAHQKYTGLSRTSETIRKRHRQVAKALKIIDVSQDLLEDVLHDVYGAEEKLNLLVGQYMQDHGGQNGEPVPFTQTTPSYRTAGVTAPASFHSSLPLPHHDSTALADAGSTEPGISTDQTLPARSTFGGKKPCWGLLQSVWEAAHEDVEESDFQSDVSDDSLDPNGWNHFEYQVQRRECSTLQNSIDGSLIEEASWLDVDGPYLSLVKANAAASGAVLLMQVGDNPIVDALQPFTTEHNMDDNGASQCQYESELGIVQTRVVQRSRAFRERIAVPSKTGWLPRTLYHIKQRITKYAEDGLFEEGAVTELRETFVDEGTSADLDWANSKAITKWVDLTYRPKSANLDLRDVEKTQLRKKLKDGLDEDSLFNASKRTAEVLVEMWVEKGRLYGPRNL